MHANQVYNTDLVGISKRSDLLQGEQQFLFYEDYKYVDMIHVPVNGHNKQKYNSINQIYITCTVAEQAWLFLPLLRS